MPQVRWFVRCAMTHHYCRQLPKYNQLNHSFLHWLSLISLLCCLLQRYPAAPCLILLSQFERWSLSVSCPLSYVVSSLHRVAFAIKIMVCPSVYLLPNHGLSVIQHNFINNNTMNYNGRFNYYYLEDCLCSKLFI